MCSLYLFLFILTNLFSKGVPSNHKEIFNNLQYSNSGFKNENQYCEIQNKITKAVTYMQKGVCIYM